MRWLCLPLTLLPVWAGWSAAPEKRAEDGPIVVEIENTEGLTLKAEIVSVIRVNPSRSLLCFRPLSKDRLFLYPFTSLSPATLTRLSGIHSQSGLVVVDGATSEELGFLNKYLAAGPRGKLLLELGEARKKERLLEREWKRLQEQTWTLQQQVARTKDPELRARNAIFFQKCLMTRNRAGKRLSLCRVKIRRMEERIAVLRRMGVDIEDDVFAGH